MTFMIYFNNGFKFLTIDEKNSSKELASRREFINKIDCILYAKELAEANGLTLNLLIEK